ncbi:hypothetical protein D3C80_1723480 [compost metagenome]
MLRDIADAQGPVHIQINQNLLNLSEDFRLVETLYVNQVHVGFSIFSDGEMLGLQIGMLNDMAQQRQIGCHILNEGFLRPDNHQLVL